MSESNGFPHPKKAAFLAAYAECGTVTQAARAADIDRCTHYDWMKSDTDYAALFGLAHKAACDTLESEARRRAIEGWEEPVFQNGECVGHKRRFSDALLIFLMKGNNPTKFGDKVEQTHKGDAESPVQIYMPHNGRDTESE